MYNAHWSCHVSNDKVQVKYTTSLIKKPRKQFTLDVVTPNMEVVNRNAPSCCPQPFTGFLPRKMQLPGPGMNFLYQPIITIVIVHEG